MTNFLRTSFYVGIGITSLTFCSPLIAMEEETTSINQNPSIIGDYHSENFVPMRIDKQLERYREIYDTLLRDHPEDPYQAHSDVLFSILKNAFILTRQYIKEALVETVVKGEKSGKERQTQFLTYLNTLYDAALIMNNNDEMSPLYFERLNLLCALIGQEYRKYHGGNGSFYKDRTWHLWRGESFDPYKKEKGFEDALTEGTENIVTFLKENMNETFIGEYDRHLRKGKAQCFAPMAILYFNREVPIGYGRFVDLFFNDNYPIFLAELFPINVPTTLSLAMQSFNTKQNVHYSRVQSFFTMTAHDFEHRDTILQLLDFFQTKFGSSWHEYLRPLYNMILLNQDQNAKNVIINGLFLLTHELLIEQLHDKKRLKNIHPKDLKAEIQRNEDEFRTAAASQNTSLLLETVIERYMQDITENLLNRKLEKSDYRNTYKTQRRDNEYVFMNVVDGSGIPFLPLIQVEGQKKLLPMAKNSDGAPVLMIAPTKDFSLIQIKTFGCEQEDYIPYQKDSNGNVLLPDGWIWMTKEERKASQLSDFDRYQLSLEEKEKENTKDAIYAFRQNYVVSFLTDGYSRFWNYFLTLAKET